MPLFFALTLFVSATLLFLVQPMIAKMVLPTLGGTPAVWNTCMVFFFQAVLLAGYTYAHVATAWLGVRRQAFLHCLLLLLPLLVLPIALNPGWLPRGDANPIPWLLAFLLVTAGLPFFVVSTSAPLLQKWFAGTGHPSANDPYFLYAASNLGSMLALISYPALVEPHLHLATQSWDWSIGYGALIVLTMGCAFVVWKTVPAAVPQRRPGKAAVAVAVVEAADRPTVGRRLRWIALAFVPSSLMLGATTYITTDIAAIPLLWVLPLSLYLLSFIIVFAKMPPWLDKLLLVGLVAAGAYFASTLIPASFEWNVFGLTVDRQVVQWIIRLLPLAGLTLLYAGIPPLLHRTMVVCLPLLVLLMVFMMASGIRPSTVPLIVLHLTLLFVTAMVCHGEIARDRPSTTYLTQFFLLMSVGGVLGGMFNALVAPLVFTQLTEYPLVMALACMLVPPLGGESKPSRVAFWVDLVLAIMPAVLGLLLLYQATKGKPLLNEDRPWEFRDLLSRDAWESIGQRIRNALDLGNVRSVALLGAAVVGLLAYVIYRKSDWPARLLDVAAALALGLLSAGLILGLATSGLDLSALADKLHLKPFEDMLRTLLKYGIPVVLCYTLLARPVRFGLGIAALMLASYFCENLNSSVVYRDRSFFGVLKVKYDKEDNSRELVHGTTLHGMQYLDEKNPGNPQTFEKNRRNPQTYYHRTGPIGQVFEDIIEKEKKINVALIGLGTGTLASYAEKGQHFTFYEIDKAVLHISRDSGLFTYYPDAEKREADVKVVLGDARLRLKEADDGQYDLIVVDAFSSDAIPIHLITEEALSMYRKKLAPGGIVAFHTSNRYLDLDPVVANLADALGMVTIKRSDTGDTRYPGKSASTWDLVANQVADFGNLADDLEVSLTLKEALTQANEIPDGQFGLVTVHAQCAKEEPTEFLTKEVLATLRSKLKPGGRVGIHIRTPGAAAKTVLVNLAREVGPAAVLQDEPEEEGITPRSWLLIAEKDADFAEQKEAAAAGRGFGRRWELMLRDPNRGVWTDDYSNLLSVFNWGAR